MESSRIFIKGLPPTFTDDDVRRHFNKFPVTDVRFFPRRRIGYVGYRTPDDAAHAVKHFNKSFIRMSKIFVEIARPISDEALPKSRQQQRGRTSTSTPTRPAPTLQEASAKRKRTADDVDADPRLREFLDVMQPPSKTTAWADSNPNVDALGASSPAIENNPANVDNESDGEYQVITKKAKLARQIDEPVEDVEPTPGPLVAPVVDDGEAAGTTGVRGQVTNNSPDEAGPISDSDWLRSRTSRALDLVEDDEELPSPKSATVAASDAPIANATNKETLPVRDLDIKQESRHVAEELVGVHPSLTAEEKIGQTGRLYLRNLHFDVTSDDLDTYFSQFGTLEEVHVPTKKADGKGKGFAFLQYRNPEHAVNAFEQSDGIIFQGRLLHIISAESKRDSKLDDFSISKLPLKKQREIKRRAGAANPGFNWNSLYMNADAVMSTIADRLGVDKSEVLDPTSSNAAVKQAHAETHLIQEIKKYFAQHGVDLEAFKRSSKGDTAILVKNVPAGTSQAELRRLFEEHGTLKTFLMPPTGLTAIIEFPNAAQAKSAFGSLAYRKLGDSILYLEKAPKELFKEGVATPAQVQSTSTDVSAPKLSAIELLQDTHQSVTSATTTLYIRNLDFSTTTQRLNEVFASLQGFRSARVKTKVDPKRGVLSMGFGFVEFSSAESASAALRTMDGYSLDGHQLQIRVSHKGLDAAEEQRREDAAKKAAGTKILIKNLPFQASVSHLPHYTVRLLTHTQKKDVRALFGAYGQLRSVRVPKKFDSSSRGFGFADFVTKRDAANALDALRNTHLLGRRLVLSFAEAETDDPEQELEKMQQKVGAQANKVALQRLTGGGRKKFNAAGNDDLDEG